MRQVLLLALLTATTQAQWQLQQSHTSASLRGIHALGNGVAWASGTEGTVLRTTDDGTTWQTCPTPPGAEHLDFRGIQAFDAKTAIVMSSGKGDLSRLYKTTDSCQTWKLLFTNPDKEGFWDGVQFTDVHHGFLLGDSVLVLGSSQKRVVFKQTIDGGKTWISWEQKVSDFAIGENASAFAASNSAMIALDPSQAMIVTGGKDGSAIGFPINDELPPCPVLATGQAPRKVNNCLTTPERRGARELNVFWKLKLPFPQTESGGAFSIACSEERIVIVGGDYKLPNSSVQNAAHSDWRLSSDFTPSQTPPHGYRSAVAYSPTHRAWVTVGPNGTDLSTDDGRTWRSLRLTAPDADREEDQHWNALSLPFVVGPKGRIGKLRENALTH